MSSLSARRTRLRNRILTSNALMARLLPHREGSNIQAVFTSIDDSSDEEVQTDGGHIPPPRYDLREAAEDVLIDLPSARTFSRTNQPDDQEKMAMT